MIISYFLPDRWLNCNVGIILPLIRRVGYSNIFSVLYPYSYQVLFLSLKWLTFPFKYQFFLLFLFICQMFNAFLSYHKFCKLNRNLPWEDRDDSGIQTEQVLGLKGMLVPILAGILSALRRVIARRVSIKVVTVTENCNFFLFFSVRCFLGIVVLMLNISCLQNQLRRRLHALTIASATCFMFPIAMWDVIIVSSVIALFP